MRRIDTILLAAALFLAVSCNWNEIIVDVKPMLPEIVLDNSSAVYSMTAGEQLTVSPIYKYVVGATYAWTCDGKVLSNESVLHYTDTVAHTVFIKITVTTEYGSTSDEIRVDVLAPPPDPDPEPVPDDDFWVFPQTVFNVSLGRSIQLKPYDIKEADDIDYVWTVNGSEVQASKASEYIFEAKQEGSYDVCVTHGKLSQTLTVNVCPAEGTFYRPASATSEALYVALRNETVSTTLVDEETVLDTYHFVLTASNDALYLASKGIPAYVLDTPGKFISAMSIEATQPDFSPMASGSIDNPTLIF